ncbi:hypothetical protein JCM11251_001644 [Rhodosporidiobolus azoricus]
MVGSSLRVFLLVAAASSVEAFWRMPCGNNLVVERADSIVSPGAVSGHVHAILGGSNFGLSATFEGLRESDCTSCLVKQDMSNYWTPQLYFQWANGSFTSVEPGNGGGLIYYLPRSNPTDTTKVTAFPDGLRMLTGNPFKRSYDPSSLTDQAIGWNCLGAPVSETRQPYLPPYNCPNGLRGEIRFPSCWNGKDLDSADHHSHMAYPIGGEIGPCPSTHPVRLVTIFYEILWSVDRFNQFRSQAMNAQQPFVLAQGDSTGYGYHGDFFNGWDRGVLQEAIDTCTSDTGVIEYCKVFDLYESGHTCRKTPDIDEVVLGTLPALPGCNPVTGAGANAIQCATASTPKSAPGVPHTGSAPPVGAYVPGTHPAVLTSYKSKAGMKWTYQDCYSDLVNGRALPNGLSTKKKTVEACLEACQANGYKLCGVEYHGECWGGNVLLGGSSALGAGACGLTCSDNPLQYCGGGGGPTGAAMELYTRQDAVFTPVPQSTTITTRRTTSTSTSTSTSTVQATTPGNAVTTTASPKPTTVAQSSSASSSSSTRTRQVWHLAPTSTSAVPRTSSTSNQAVTSTTTSTTRPVSSSSSTSTATSSTRTRQNWYIAPTSTSSVPHSSTTSTVAPTSTSSPSPSTSTRTSTTTSKKPVFYVAPTTTKSVLATASVTASATSAPQPLFTVASTAIVPSTKLANDTEWKYVGCYSDLINGGRSLPNLLTRNGWTIETCLAAARKANYAIAGLIYSGECWAANTLSPLSSLQPSSSCSWACGDARLTQTCGGEKTLDVYVRASLVAISPAGGKVKRKEGGLGYEERKKAVRGKVVRR